MIAAPVVVIVATTVLIGLYMGFRFLQGVRNKPWLGGLHLLLGAAGLEVMAMLLRGAPNGDAVPAEANAHWAGGLIVAALLSGLFVAIIAKPMPNRIGMTLAVHASFGLLGFAALLLWAMKL